jgi:hypothetical protein
MRRTRIDLVSRINAVVAAARDTTERVSSLLQRRVPPDAGPGTPAEGRRPVGRGKRAVASSPAGPARPRVRSR